MMAWLVGKQLLGMTITAPIARLISIAVLVLLALALTALGIAYIRHDAVSDHEAKIEARAKPATDQAATERATDTIADAHHEEELHNAVHSVPDAPPAGPSRALACRRLRDNGLNSPACS